MTLKKLNHYIRSVSYLNSRKFFNFMLAEFSFRVHSMMFDKFRRPVFLSVEPADFCQLRCPQCPVGMAARNKGALVEDKVVFDTLTELKKSLIQVIFYFQGEPLLNPRLNEYIRFAHVKT